jgi:hypothetical protein
VRCRSALALLSILAAAGCDTIPREQYRVAGVPPGSPDAAELAAVVKRVAGETGLEDRTATSIVAGTLVFYREPAKHFPIDLGARHYEGDVLVDVMGRIGPVTPTFKRLKRRLGPALRAEFGNRVSMPKPVVEVERGPK